jgi:NAD(P)-dependent dehydrogenase (short-subunit alcohol dehydrogenase family)
MAGKLVLKPMSSDKLFDLTDRVAVITGGAGLLGIQHALAIHAQGGIPIVADLDEAAAKAAAEQVGKRALGIKLDVTNSDSVQQTRSFLTEKFGKINILINNAANNPKVEPNKGGTALGRLEDIDLRTWELDLAVGLTGAMLCSRHFGEHMAQSGGGVILNIASDLALVGPNQSLYEKAGAPPNLQPKKPVSYSVVKSGLIGLTRYLSTYWADRGVRTNALCPGGVENNTPPDFIERIAKLIPMGRMARVNEYQGAIIFLCSDASSYMNGAIVSIDGGRTAW